MFGRGPLPHTTVSPIIIETPPSAGGRLTPTHTKTIIKLLKRNKNDIKLNNLKSKEIIQRQQLNSQNIEHIYGILKHALILPKDLRENNKRFNKYNYISKETWNEQLSINRNTNKHIQQLRQITKQQFITHKINAIERFVSNYKGYLNKLHENPPHQKQIIKICNASKKLKKILLLLNDWTLTESFSIVNTGKFNFDIIFEITNNEILDIEYVGNIRNDWNNIYKPRTTHEQIIYCFQTMNGQMYLRNKIELIPFYGQQFNVPGSAQKIFFCVKPLYYRNNNGEKN